MVGIDIVEIRRIERIMERHGDAFLKRIFTVEEIGYLKVKKKPGESVAGRFAAKEAFMKAFGRWIPWREIEVLNRGGRPFIRFDNGTFDGVSISHERTHAVAVVILNCGDTPADPSDKAGSSAHACARGVSPIRACERTE